MDTVTLTRNLENALREVSEKVDLQVHEMTVDVDEDTELLSEQDIIAIITVGVLTPTLATAWTMMATGTIVSKAVAVAAFSSFGVASVDFMAFFIETMVCIKMC